MGHKVFPLFHFYGATKFAVNALTEGLRQELRELGSKIRVSSISPGRVQTELYLESLKQNKLLMNQQIQALEVSEIADAVCYLLSRPEHVQVHDLKITTIEEIFC